MPKRLALIDPLSRHGGMHYYDHELANALADSDFAVDLFSPPTGLEEFARYGVHKYFDNVYGAHGGSKLRRAALLIRDSLISVWEAHKLKCESILIHIFKFDIFEYFIVATAKIFKMNCYAIVHDISRLDKNNQFEFRGAIVKCIDGMIVHNSFSRDTLISASPLSESKTFVMSHGNYVNRFNKLPSMSDSRKELGLAMDQIVLLFFGNPRREKGLNLLIEALSSFSDDKNLCLLVAGKMKPDDEREIRSIISDKGLSNLVRMDIGHVPDEKVPTYFRAASIVILPYLRIYESGVALMAMSFGRTILASDLPAFQDLSDDGANIMLFKAQDLTSLTQALNDIRHAGSDWERLGQEARAFVQEKRSWTGSAAALKRAISQMDGSSPE